MARLSRNTSQKILLQEEIQKSNSFFNAEELHQKVRKKDKTIGIATVYRFLKSLKEKNKIHSYTCNRRIIYSLENKNHCHFVCENCGKTEHIHVSSLDFIKNKMSGIICHFQIDIAGLCEKCREK
ncbi:MAG: hypothetical protein RL557_361 [archaeon]|jgi:Fe2+ or Zn2+ uptake regulation protein